MAGMLKVSRSRGALSGVLLVLLAIWGGLIPVGGHIARAMEQIGFFTGLGVVIVCIASVALGRLSLVSIRDTSVAERATDGMTAGSDGETASRRWPIPMPASMRRVASTSDGGSTEPVGSSASKS